MSLLNDVADVFNGLGELAGAGTISRHTAGAYDPVAGKIGIGSTASCACQVVLDTMSIRGLGFKFSLDDGMVQTGFIDALIPAKGLTFAPMPDDTLTVNGTPYNVVLVRPTYAGSVPIAYLMMVRL